MLQQCRDYINSTSGAALIDTSSEGAMEWIVAAHELSWERLRAQCAESIARNYHSWEADTRFTSLPLELLTLIMREMAKQRSVYEADVVARVQLVLQKRSGKVLCRTKVVGGGPYDRHDTYKFFCGKIECPGHELTAITATNFANVRQLYQTNLQGSLHCVKSNAAQLIGQRVGGTSEGSDEAHKALPDSLQTLLQVCYIHVNVQ